MSIFRFRYFAFFLLLTINSNGYAQVIADALPGCLNVANMEGIGCGGGTTTFGINGLGQFEVQNVDGINCCPVNGGDWNSYFEFEQLNISCFEDIMISFDYSAAMADYEDDFPGTPQFGCTGTPVDNSHDQIVFAYSINGGAEVQSLYVHGTTQADFTGAWIEGPLNGNTLTIRVYASNKATAEHFYFENLVISASVSPIDAGPNQTICATDPVVLQGTGNGTWSGGSGTFSDVTDPTATYTPAASEFNTTVILTFEGCTPSSSCTVANSDDDEVEITFYEEPTASIDQLSDGELCFGECTSISFDFVGGTQPYALDISFQITGVGFPVDFPVPGFAASDVVTICYDIPGFFPSYDPTTVTISVPEAAAGLSGTFTLNSFTDANNCDGVVTGGNFNVAFLETPDALFAFLDECDEGGGLATFDLTEMDNDINGGSGETVRYYGDPGLVNEIFSPYVSPTSVVYATVSNADCTSLPVPVDLTVLQNGDAGTVELFCTNIGSTNCTICDSDGVAGEMIDILFVFNNPTVQHIVKLNITDVSGSTETTYTLNPNQTTLSFNIIGPTTFEILEVTEGTDCTDNTDLGGVVTIDYLLAPELAAIGPLSDCGSITLPPITGTNLSGSEMYFTETNQGGTSFAPGAILSSSVDLFVYTGVADCQDEIMVDVNILPGTTFDQPNDTTSCTSYTLPEITGTGINTTAAYYSMSGGNGDLYIPGNIILTTTTLFIFDPAASCSSNEPSFVVTIYSQPDIEVINIDTCGTYELPIIDGTLLTSNESYFTEPNGMGMQLMVGDTIFATDTIYAFDNNNGCIANEEIIINIGQGPTAGVGDTIDFCVTTNPFIVNLTALLTEPADTLGIWSDDMGVIMDDTDSTQVDLSGITGVINFMYVIENIECGNDTSHLQINLQQQFNAGGQDLLVGCEGEFSNIDLNSFWNITGIDDTIIVLGGAAIDVTNLTMVDLNDLDADMYNLQYIVGITDSICTPDTANLTIEINISPDAGEDVFGSTCVGSTVNLETLLEGNNNIGTFGDPNGTGALTGNSVNTAILGVGTFIFIHTVPGNGNCPSDNIQIELDVTNSVTAGNPVQDTICFSTEINLFDYLDGASSGGTFLDADNSNIEIPDGILAIDQWSSLPAGTAINISAIYSVGGTDCTESTAAIDLLILPEPIFDLQVIENTICGDTLNIELDYTYFFDFEFTIEINGSLPELPISILYDNFDPLLPAFGTLPLQVDLGPYNLPSGIEYTITVSSVVLGDCVTDINITPDNFIIGEEITFIVNETLCGDETVEYGGEFFNASNSSGEITIPRLGQCDSIIMVDLMFADPVTNMLNNTLCTGQSIIVAGVVYDQSNPTGSETITDGSANGCDSTIIVNLTFGNASINDVIQDICQDQPLTFNSIVYDQNNLMGSDTIVGGSIGGCDSIINVNLTLITTDVGMEMNTICDPNFSITVNSVLYNLSNPIGTETIMNGSVNGCDSMVMINLTFLDPATGIENDAICPGESIMVNGTTYDEDQLIGTETFTGQASNGCDSIVNINLSLLEIPEGPFINSSCDEDYEIIINGTTYDLNNPMGSEMIANGASNGCDSIANIQLNFDGIIAVSESIQPTCDNPNNGQLLITNITGNGPHNYIDINGATISIESLPYTIDNLSGDGTIDISDADGCQTMTSYSITDFITPILSSNVIDNQIIVTGISMDEINSIDWTPTSGLSCTDCLDPTFLITEDTEYTITINYGEGCDLTITIPVMAEEVPTVPTYTIPNVFSPNGDGNNDVFYIVPSESASKEIVSMTIYDRWGNQMYRKENYITEIGQGWDGTFNGEELNPGVFVYLIEVLENGVIKPFYGDVTIVK